MYQFLVLQSLSIDQTLGQRFPNLLEPLPKSRWRLCLITLNISQWLLIVQNNIAVLLLCYLPKNRILPLGGNLLQVWEPLQQANNFLAQLKHLEKWCVVG